MPKTIVRRQTFMCPLGVGQLGQPDACRFHRAADNLPRDGKCPIHGLVLVKTTLPEDQISMTVMGAENINVELVEEDVKRQASGLAAFSVAEKDAYRTKRLADIAAAIAKARLLEDV